MRRRTVLQAGLGLLATAAAPAPRRLVVLELFTSQGCSSCPPADMLLTELAQSRADVLPLAYHVTYWDSLGWRDPFSLPAATARQRRYAKLLALQTIYTPQLIVAGQGDIIGSDRPAVLEALAAAALPTVEMTVAREGNEAVVTLGAGPGRGSVLLVGFDRQHRTAIGRGENGGRTLLESNIVRAVGDAGAWSGAGLVLRPAAPAGERLAVLLQAPDGRILGAAQEPA